MDVSRFKFRVSRRVAHQPLLYPNAQRGLDQTDARLWTRTYDEHTLSAITSRLQTIGSIKQRPGLPCIIYYNFFCCKSRRAANDCELISWLSLFFTQAPNDHALSAKIGRVQAITTLSHPTLRAFDPHALAANTGRLQRIAHTLQNQAGFKRAMSLYTRSVFEGNLEMSDLILRPTSVKMKSQNPPKFRGDHLHISPDEVLEHFQNEIQGIQLCCHHQSLSRPDVTDVGSFGIHSHPSVARMKTETSNI